LLKRPHPIADHGLWLGMRSGARPGRRQEQAMVQGRNELAPKVLTTGQIARICNVAPRTVSKWFDLGQLRGYRIPGSRDRRVPLDQLLRFLKAHNMPLNGLDAGPRRVLVVHGDVELGQTIVQRLKQSGYDAKLAQSPFEVGLMVERVRPHVVLVDDADKGDLDEILSGLRREPQLADVKLVTLEESNGHGQAPVQAEPPRRPVDARITKPFNVTQLVETLNGLVQ
jgi:excisionase family DNA binding protein